jgi:hypothetical protein
MSNEQQTYRRFKKTHNLPNADEEIVNLLVGATKDHKRAYNQLAQFKALKEAAKGVFNNPGELQAFCQKCRDSDLTVDDLFSLIV